MPRRAFQLMRLCWVAVASAWALSCGADDLQAPRAQRSSAVSSCGSLSQLMPGFVRAIRSGKTEGLRRVVEAHLVSPSEDGRVPMNEVLRVIFKTLSGFAKLPPEKNALPGERCAAQPPPLAESNPMCEMRRAMEVLVHQGKGLEALELLSPLMGSSLSYVVGRPPASTVPHLEVASVMNRMCEQTLVCSLNDVLDVVIAFIAVAQEPGGEELLNGFSDLVNNPALRPYLTDPEQAFGGEEGVVVLVKLLINTVGAMKDPSELDSLPIDKFPPELQAPLRKGLTDLKRVLSPSRQPNLLHPLQRVLNCVRIQDAGMDLVRMTYRLAFVAKIPEFSAANLVSVVKDLRNTDQRGTLLNLISVLATAIRQDQAAVLASGKVCQAFFSHAELALPSVVDLFNEGVMTEAVCAADILLFGCSGGLPPACAGRQP